MLTYVDGLFCIYHEPSHDLNRIDKYFKMKTNSREVLKSYLGGQIITVTLLNDIQAWNFTSSKYVQEVLNNVENHIFTEYRMKLPTKVITPFTFGYRPELDTSRELNDAEALLHVPYWYLNMGGRTRSYR